MAKKKFNTDLRQEYHSPHINISLMAQQPFEEFEKWWQSAQKNSIPEMNAAALSTINSEKRVHSRMILIKDFSKNGFIFFTNYSSQKAQDLFFNPQAALLIWWQKISRQIRIEGKVEKVSEEVSNDYFYSRPHEYQLGAWTSHQSEKISSPEELQKKYAELKKKYENSLIPRPPYWGGFILIPDYFEFWIGNENRLHDRVAYHLDSNLNWEKYYLSP